ncbi:hypothetical protein VTK73DRAFT_8205 [Phialemonium thermophilum]|uniref:Core domain-containing protein n=1 Tax=Phialemonium thermophilum TaxID=223376 RepID=A0ABR3W9Y9_9PEZI
MMNSPAFVARRGFSICMSCRRSLMRQFSSTSASLVTFHAYPLPSQPPPSPRNASVPDTSIARPVQPAVPKVHETRPPKEAMSAPAPAPAPQTSLREEQAQSSQHDFAAAPSVASATSSQPAPESLSKSSTTADKGTATPRATPPTTETATTPSTSKPRSRLRTPRKAALKLTPAAVEQLRVLVDQPEPKLIKVGVRNRGCSGLAYHLEYVDKPGPFDETVEQDGVKVLIDSKALFSIIGSEMDWVEDKLNQRFVFRNPNIKEQCGCGESFMV